MTMLFLSKMANNFWEEWKSSSQTPPAALSHLTSAPSLMPVTCPATAGIWAVTFVLQTSSLATSFSPRVPHLLVWKAHKSVARGILLPSSRQYLQLLLYLSITLKILQTTHGNQNRSSWSLTRFSLTFLFLLMNLPLSVPIKSCHNLGAGNQV